jgi:outer membrane protein
MTSRNVTALLFSLALFLPPSAALSQGEADSAQVRLGYVDIQHAIRSVDDGREAMQRLEQELTRRQSQLNERERELRSLTEELDRDLVMLDGDARRERLMAYQQQVEEYQRLYMSQQQELYELEQGATREIVERMLRIVAELARERGLTMVFEKTRSALVWAADGLDLTEELIRRYEAE